MAYNTILIINIVSASELIVEFINTECFYIYESAYFKSNLNANN
jgi:hypothetical protein